MSADQSEETGTQRASDGGRREDSVVHTWSEVRVRSTHVLEMAHACFLIFKSFILQHPDAE